MVFSPEGGIPKLEKTTQEMFLGGMPLSEWRNLGKTNKAISLELWERVDNFADKVFSLLENDEERINDTDLNSIFKYSINVIVNSGSYDSELKSCIKEQYPLLILG